MALFISNADADELRRELLRSAACTMPSERAQADNYRRLAKLVGRPREHFESVELDSPELVEIAERWGYIGCLPTR